MVQSDIRSEKRKENGKWKKKKKEDRWKGHEGRKVCEMRWCVVGGGSERSRGGFLFLLFFHLVEVNFSCGLPMV